MTDEEEQMALSKLVKMKSFDEDDSKAMNSICRLLLNPCCNTLEEILKSIQAYGKFSVNPTKEASDKIFILAFALELCRPEIGDRAADEILNSALDIRDFRNAAIAERCFRFLLQKRDPRSIYQKLIDSAKQYSKLFSNIIVSNRQDEELKSIRRYEMRLYRLNKQNTLKDGETLADVVEKQSDVYEAINVLSNAAFKIEHRYPTR
jgi:hypothetical protein